MHEITAGSQIPTKEMSYGNGRVIYTNPRRCNIRAATPEGCWRRCPNVINIFRALGVEKDFPCPAVSFVPRGTYYSRPAPIFLLMHPPRGGRRFSICISLPPIPSPISSPVRQPPPMFHSPRSTPLPRALTLFLPGRPTAEFSAATLRGKA